MTTLNDWPCRKQCVFFPSTTMFPLASPRGTLRFSGNQNSLFPWGQSLSACEISGSFDLSLCSYFKICVNFFCHSEHPDISMEAMHKHQVSTIKTAARNATQYFDGIRWTPGNKGVYVH